MEREWWIESLGLAIYFNWMNFTKIQSYESLHRGVTVLALLRLSFPIICYYMQTHVWKKPLYYGRTIHGRLEVAPPSCHSLLSPNQTCLASTCKFYLSIIYSWVCPFAANGHINDRNVSAQFILPHKAVLDCRIGVSIWCRIIKVASDRRSSEWRKHQRSSVSGNGNSRQATIDWRITVIIEAR